MTFLYKHMEKLYGAISLIQRRESTIRWVISLVLIHSVYPYKKIMFPSAPKTPHELDPIALSEWETSE